jgi:hypothetical protein
MCDKLVFDLSQEVEGSPNVFIRKDWINILDNQNQNYQNNQSIIDTSQLSNSNKYMGYREAYLAVPLLLTLTTPANNNCNVQVTAGYGYGDYAIGLKNWFGQIIHSFTLDYNGTTIVQQTPFINMWNTFKLLTTLSYSDIITQGSTIGFYPDTASSWTYATPNGLFTGGSLAPPTASMNGIFVCNNDLSLIDSPISSSLSANGKRYLCSGQLSNSAGVNQIDETAVFQDNIMAPSVALGGNVGLSKRISWINYNPALSAGSSAPYGVLGVSNAACNQIWKSYIIRQVDGQTAAIGPPIVPGVCGQMQINVMATIYLKHVHSFFNMIPLLKGVFMKMTMNLNNASSIITVDAPTTGAAGGAVATSSFVSTYASTVAVGGVNPLHIPSFRTGSLFSQGLRTLVPLNPVGDNSQVQTGGQYYYNLSVGARIIGNDNPNVTNIALSEGQLSKSIYLYVPAYTFNPVFEEAYLSNPVKQIKYTDVYQYQVQNIGGGGNTQFNNLITNGIANIKSVLLIPFYSQNNTASAFPFQLPSPEYQSPFDCAGCGTTAPMVTLGNFNVQISGQNAIYNTQRYTFEEFNNQLYGQFAVNGGLTDGLTSGLIGFEEFKQSYCYYYVNVERMLPVEQSVPKSVQIIGTNYSTQAIDLWVFIEYGVEINIDLTTGARV